MEKPLGTLDIRCASERRSVTSNTIWNLAGNILYAGCQWALISVLAKRGGAGPVGEFGLGLAISAPVFMLGNLQLRAIQTTDVKERHTFEDYLGLRLITAACCLLAAIVISWFLAQSRADCLIVASVALVKAVESVADIYQGVFQKRERMDLLARSLTLKGSLSLAAFSAAYLCTASVFWACIAMAGAQATSLTFYDAPASGRLDGRAGSPRRGGRFGTPRSRFDHISEILKGALPLGIAMMFLSLQTNVPRLAIQRHMGVRPLGVFVGITYIATGGAIIISAMGAAAVPRLATYWAAGDRHAFRTLTSQLSVIALLFGGLTVLGSAILGRQALRVLYSEEYASHVDLLLLAMSGGAVAYILSAFGCAATAMGQFRVQAPILGVTTGGLFVLCAILVPRHGLIGAAWAILISTCCSLFAYVLVVWRKAYAAINA